MSLDPTQTDPDKYAVIFENERVRVLEYKDRPGDRTSPHRHRTASCTPSARSSAA
ncbi:MAG: hypothetical protein ACXWWL_02420 [Candidatus Limnocylindria bacterium]